MGISKVLKTYSAKLLTKETKWTSSEVRTHLIFLETLISKCDFGPVELPGLSRNKPQGRVLPMPVDFLSLLDKKCFSSLMPSVV